jgi:hypothetical protein
MSPACNKQSVKSQQRFRNVPNTNVNVNFSSWARGHCEGCLSLCQDAKRRKKREQLKALILITLDTNSYVIIILNLGFVNMV